MSAKPTVLHALAIRLEGGRYAWPECGGSRGPLHIESGRFAPDIEHVTCRRCLKRLTPKPTPKREPLIHTSGRTDPRFIPMPVASGYLGADHNDWDGAV